VAAEDYIETGWADALAEEDNVAVVRKEKGGRTEKVLTKKKKHGTEDGGEDSGPYKLPSSVTEPVDNLSDCLVLIYGYRKIGKTSMLSHAPKNLNLATEVGYRGLRLVKEDLKTWLKAERVLRALKKDKSFRTVTIDTVDLLYRLAEVATCLDLGVDALGDAEWGKGWSECRRKLSDFMNALTQTGKGVVLLSHANEQGIRRREGGEYDRIMPTMPKQMREVVEPMIDIYACYQYDDDRRVLTVAGDEHLAAGHRFENRFRTPDGRRLKNIDMGHSAAEAWKNFNDAFHNRYEPTTEEDVVEEDRRRTKSDKKKTTFKLKK
jgi:hypothetical protein